MARRFAGARLVAVIAGSVALAGGCFAVWFFPFAGSSLPTT